MTNAWTDWNSEFRVVYTPELQITDATKVLGSAMQFPTAESTPALRTRLRCVSDDWFTTSQARELAAALTATADLLDKWVTL